MKYQALKRRQDLTFLCLYYKVCLFKAIFTSLLRNMANQTVGSLSFVVFGGLSRSNPGALEYDGQHLTIIRLLIYTSDTTIAPGGG